MHLLQVARIRTRVSWSLRPELRGVHEWCPRFRSSSVHSPALSTCMTANKRARNEKERWRHAITCQDKKHEILCWRVLVALGMKGSLTCVMSRDRTAIIWQSERLFIRSRLSSVRYKNLMRLMIKQLAGEDQTGNHVGASASFSPDCCRFLIQSFEVPADSLSGFPPTRVKQKQFL